MNPQNKTAADKIPIGVGQNGRKIINSRMWQIKNTMFQEHW